MRRERLIVFRGRYAISYWVGRTRYRLSIGARDRESAELVFQHWRAANVRPAEPAAIPEPARGWLRIRLRTATHGGARRGRHCSLTIADLETMFARSGGRCEVSGIPFDLSPMVARERNPFRLSLDRVDSRLGYTPDNCRLVCVAVNYAMGQWGEGTLRMIARALVDKESTTAMRGVLRVASHRSRQKRPGGRRSYLSAEPPPTSISA